MNSKQFREWYKVNFGHTDEERENFMRRLNKVLMAIGGEPLHSFSSIGNWMYGRGNYRNASVPTRIAGLKFEQVLRLVLEVEEITEGEFLKKYLEIASKNFFSNLEELRIVNSKARNQENGKKKPELKITITYDEKYAVYAVNFFYDGIEDEDRKNEFKYLDNAREYALSFNPSEVVVDSGHE